MRVAYILGEHPSLTETFIQREINALRTHGVEVCVFALRPGRTRDPQAIYPHPSVLARCRQVRCADASALARWTHRILMSAYEPPRTPWPHLRLLPAAVEFAEHFRRLGVEHVHAHWLHTPATAGIVAAELARLPFSFSAHAWDIWCSGQIGLARWKAAGARFGVVCTAYGLRQLRRQLAPAPVQRLHLIYHGLPLAEHPFDHAAASPPLLLGVGRLTAKKGFEQLIDATVSLRVRGWPLQCEIIGEGPLRPALQARIDAHHAGDFIHLPGARPHGQVLARMRSATCVVAPSRMAPDGDRDGLPNVLLEAAAVGAPIVATNFAGIPELVEHGVTGLLCRPADSGSLTDVLEQTLHDPTAAAHRAVAARQKIERQFDIMHNVARLAALFRRQ